MRYSLKRLRIWYFRVLYALAMDGLLMVQYLNKMGFLRPWFLPERRKANGAIILERRTIWISPFGLALWLVAFYIFGIITWGDPRHGIELALTYGILIALYIFLRLGGIIRRNLVAYEHS